MKHAWGSALGYRTTEPQGPPTAVQLLFDAVEAVEQQQDPCQARDLGVWKSWCYHH